MYALAGLDNKKLGWGRRDETWSSGGTARGARRRCRDWFRLGDRDPAVHVERTRRLRRGDAKPAIADSRAVGSASVPACCRRRMIRCARSCERMRDGLISRIISVRSQRRHPVVRERPSQARRDARPHPELLAALRDERLRACDHLPVQPVHQRRAHPGCARDAPGSACRLCGMPSHRGFSPSSVAARSKVRPPSDDGGGARNDAERRGGGEALRRSHRWLRDGYRRRGGGRPCGGESDARAHAYDRTSRSASNSPVSSSRRRRARLSEERPGSPVTASGPSCPSGELDGRPSNGCRRA